jgi:hypothetical protein
VRYHAPFSFSMIYEAGIGVVQKEFAAINGGRFHIHALL